jgi:hypothetical protein
LPRVARVTAGLAGSIKRSIAPPNVRSPKSRAVRLFRNFAMRASSGRCGSSRSYDRIFASAVFCRNRFLFVPRGCADSVPTPASSAPDHAPRSQEEMALAANLTVDRRSNGGRTSMANMNSPTRAMPFQEI